MTKIPALLTLAFAAIGLTACDSSSNSTASNDTPPNILFVVLDDLGVDQLPVFGYGGLTPASTPNLDAIAHAGVRFRNAWSMPTCTPTRATFFQGRYPMRTDVLNAVVALDLANSQVSPFEKTTPKLLKEKGYVNALIGKMHLSGSDLNTANNPLGNGVMHELGWDYFEGYLDGGPYPIDTTAGGVSQVNNGFYGCGFVPNTTDDPTYGADSGACYQASGSCSALSLADAPTPGRTCMEHGGIFDPGQSCKPVKPAYLDFETQNGYYTGEWIINLPDGSVQVLPASDASSRGYRSIMETDRALAWLKQQSADQPWMLSVGYSAIHTPLHQPPVALLPAGSEETGAFTCGTGVVAEQRTITNQMLEGLDSEIGRLLVEAGIAQFKPDGTLDYQPEKTNTVVVIMADNGTYAPSVKAPFNPARAKGFPYQGGVWVPLIVAGPMVSQPDRDVPHMVNSTDLYSLFAEVAGIDLATAVPASHSVDAEALLPYLTNPSQASIRSVNYTEMGTNITSTTVPSAPPCVIPASNVCVQVFPQEGVCLDQSGIWYGPGGVAGAQGLGSCCAVNDYRITQGEEVVDIMPDSQRAIRNEFYKLVRIERLNCSTNQLESTDEFYHVNQATPIPKLDNKPGNLLAHAVMTPEHQQNYESLKTELQKLTDSRIQCPGDGNLDLIVDAADVQNWKRFSTENGGNSSWYDFNHDGLTNEADLAVINQNMGRDCRPA
ncbi:putative lipoprotein [Pusillimonas sp. T7-7]|uniref:sulfatase-like hydrolase/transferase n=1 Tax=Pusillimonas sp. (strain T7-7) TaxID=1007105 RepID=UPI0002085537|nr:sulfatase-like hydrolase/transferase [Pusillimonas sp. T7-7]AEC19687.1 putative lipoprotein [Pusillimonas sp. T7-7]